MKSMDKIDKQLDQQETVRANSFMDTAFSLDPKLERHTSLNSALHPSTMLPKAQLMKEHAYYKKFFDEH